MITTKLYQKKNKLRDDGTAPIYYVLAKGKKQKLISTRKYVEPKLFDNSTGLVLRGANNSVKLNTFFRSQLTKLDSIIMDFINDDKEPTFESIERKFNNDNSKDFISFAINELKQQRGLIAEKTLTGYEQCLNNLKKYTPQLAFNQVNHDWLTRYKHYLVNVQGRMTNGYYQDFATIKKFWRIAKANGEAKHDPFENFPLSKEETTRNWHPEEELTSLFSLIKMEGLSPEIREKVNELLTTELTEKDKKHLRHFLKIEALSDAVKYNLIHYLFCCFSGLRFGDKRDFDDKKVINDRIQLKTNKTGKHILIPFNDQARELLPFILERPLKQGNNRVNTELKICMLLVGIEKHITFHCSRHTFAINCILLGIDLITVRDWLGHKSVTTTEIYAKIAQQYKDENMKKWDNFGKLKVA